MFRILKWIGLLALIAGIGYLGFFVQFGKKTFYGHVVGIFQTREARNLSSEVEKKYKKTTKTLKRKIDQQVSDIANETKKTAKPVAKALAEQKKALKEKLEQDAPAEHTEKDQSELKKLFKNKINEIATDIEE